MVINHLTKGKKLNNYELAIEQFCYKNLFLFLKKLGLIIITGDDSLKFTGKNN